MKYPLDVLNKRQFVYLGDIAHEYYNFPGKYDSPCPNEYPSVNGSSLRTDTSYFISENKFQRKFFNNFFIHLFIIQRTPIILSFHF